MVTAPANEDKTVILFSTADWDTPYWTNKQHTARLLRDRGYRVLYVESFGLRAPGINSKDLRRILQRLRRGLKPIAEVEPGIFVFSPLLIPWRQHLPVMQRINRQLLQTRILRFLKQQKFGRPVVWTYHPFVLPLLNEIKYTKLVYHLVDDLSAVPGIQSDALKAAEKALVQQCDAVFNTSLALQSNMNQLAPGRSHYFNNVADIELFSQARKINSAPKDFAQIPAPRIGYVGVLSDFKVDFTLILAVAQKRPDWHWVFIGEEREGQNDKTLAALAGLPNVHLLGYRPYKDIPRLLAGLDVAVLPTLINDYTRAMFPMKFFEYLAAGLPVVSTSLPSLVEYSHLFHRANSPDEFLQAIDQLLKKPKSERSVQLETIANQNWDERLDKMLTILHF
jgi:glycosyltransferase involved in cell wall biosynthesis